MTPGLTAVFWIQCPSKWCEALSHCCFGFSSKVMLKILQARFQQYMNQELSDVQAGFRKGKATRGQITKVCWIIEKKKKKNSRKISTSALLTVLKPLCGSLETVENS